MSQITQSTYCSTDLEVVDKEVPEDVLGVIVEKDQGEHPAPVLYNTHNTLQHLCHKHT